MTARTPPPAQQSPDWTRDHVRTAEGVSLPVRATARRPVWSDLPGAVRQVITGQAGAGVVDHWSTGTGFTPGFASRLTLADGRRLFVKAASTGYDRLHGWQLSDTYREEARKLALLPAGIGSPSLLWTVDEAVEDETWVILGFRYVDGRPPRRPWTSYELALVTDHLARIAPLLTVVPAGLEPVTFGDDFGEWPDWLTHAANRDGPSHWLDAVGTLAEESVERCSGTGLSHMDLRDDNILIDARSRVWICDWNFPMLAAPWVDLVTVLMSARGDGLEVEPVLESHPLTCDVEPRSVDALLANLWLYFSARRDEPVPDFSPHLRDHQRWYGDVTRGWLHERLGL